jgi:hypothetical protein
MSERVAVVTGDITADLPSEETGWTLAGSLGSSGSGLARDIDGAVFEFVEGR